MTNSLVSMTATVQIGDLPSDILQNINPLTLIIAIPIFDAMIYPDFCRMRIQLYIYSQLPYPDHPAENKNDVSVALEIPAYVLIAISEIFASITGLEYAFKKVPSKIKSLVMALFLFTNCLASVLGFALVVVAVDPKLTSLYTGVAAPMAICFPLFYCIHGSNDCDDIADDAIGRTKEQVESYCPTEKKDSTTP